MLRGAVAIAAVILVINSSVSLCWNIAPRVRRDEVGTEEPATTSPDADTTETPTTESTITLDNNTSTDGAAITTAAAVTTGNNTSATTVPTSTAASTVPAAPTNLTCSSYVQFAKLNESVTIVCVANINPTYAEWSEWLLEVFFRSTEYRRDDAEMEAAKVAGYPGGSDVPNSYPARTELIFSATKNSKGDTWVNQADRRGKYMLQLNSQTNKFSLTVGQVGFDDDGVFEVVLRDKMHQPMITKRVYLTVYKKPDSMDLVAPPVQVGKPYTATCTIRNYFPPRSVRVRWQANGEIIYPSAESSQRSFWWISHPNGSSYVSTITLWTAKDSSPPPKITCLADWRVENAAAKCNTSVTPKMYRPPDMSIAFKDGYAVCDITCVPTGLKVTWEINEDDAGDSSTTEVLKPCKWDSSKFDIRSKVQVYDSWAVAKYTCKLRDYPLTGQSAEVSKVLDVSPIANGKPIIAILAVVFGVALVLGLIILAVALCMYKAGTDKYRRF